MQERVLDDGSRITVLETNIDHILLRLDDIARKLDKLTDNLQTYYEKQVQLEGKIVLIEDQIKQHEKFDLAKDQQFNKDLEYVKKGFDDVSDEVEELKKFRWITLGIQIVVEIAILPLILTLLGR